MADNKQVNLDQFLNVAQRAYKAHAQDFQKRASAAHKDAGEELDGRRMGAIDLGNISAIAGTICKGWRIGWPILRPMIKAIAIFRPDTAAAIMAGLTAFNETIIPAICAVGDQGTSDAA